MDDLETLTTDELLARAGQLEAETKQLRVDVARQLQRIDALRKQRGVLAAQSDALAQQQQEIAADTDALRKRMDGIGLMLRQIEAKISERSRPGKGD